MLARDLEIERRRRGAKLRLHARARRRLRRQPGGEREPQPAELRAVHDSAFGSLDQDQGDVIHNEPPQGQSRGEELRGLLRKRDGRARRRCWARLREGVEGAPSVLVDDDAQREARHGEPREDGAVMTQERAERPGRVHPTHADELGGERAHLFGRLHDQALDGGAREQVDPRCAVVDLYAGGRSRQPQHATFQPWSVERMEKQLHADHDARNQRGQPRERPQDPPPDATTPLRVRAGATQETKDAHGKRSAVEAVALDGRVRAGRREADKRGRRRRAGGGLACRERTAHW